MKIFRTKIYLLFRVFIKSIFSSKLNFKKIDKIILHQSKKKLLTYTSQLRTGFLFILMFLKFKNKKKNEVIMMSYNLKEMANIPAKLNLTLIFCDINLKTGSINIEELKKKITEKTLCVVLTNIFSDFKSSKIIKQICKKKKIPLIEDNAIYFDNYFKSGRTYFSGSFGDYSLLSFNIMKNISGLYGGCVSHNNLEFKDYCENILKKNISFPGLIYLRQIIIYFILKLFSLNFLYKYLFYYLFYFASEYKINFIQNLIYPSLRFKNSPIPPHYISPINNFSKKLIYFQLKDLKQRKKNHNFRKINNKYYYQELRKLKSKNIFLFPITDFNFQNYLDFPVLFKKNEKILKYLIKKGYDLKRIHYFNCSNEFRSEFKFTNSERVENEIICLPNHEKINRIYINNLINEIKTFYKNN